jgi:Transposase family tnp2
MVALRVVLNVPRRGCCFLLKMLQYILQLSLLRTRSQLSQNDQKLLSDFPADPDTAVKHFRLEGKSIIYVVCPNGNCHQTYRPTFEGNSPIPIYPKYCSHKEYLNGVQCGERLTRPRCINGIDIEVPVKTFVSFDFKDWFAGLLSRPGYEERMDSVWQSKTSEDGIMHDIFDGEYVRNFKGPDGRSFGLGGEEGHYVFSLSVDFFNPYTNKQSGKKYSTGLISVVCLNLPPSMRYKPENMFLSGVVPGPKEPPLTALNHYLKPLVDDLIDFWEAGVKFSRTYNYETGRLVRCALILLVCDLPGARKAAGFAAFSHEHFCSVCHCTRSQHGYDDLDYHAWRRRTNSECRLFASRFEAAKDKETRADLFKQSGMRWSELLRLPYFDIVQCVVVDAMHNLFLGLIRLHFNDILGIGSSRFEEDPVLSIKFSVTPTNFTESEKKSVEKLKKWLEAPESKVFPSERELAIKKLKTLHVKALRFACDELHCPLPPPAPVANRDYSKDVLAGILLDWVCKLYLCFVLC